jgi:hypothetical protein
LLPREVTAQNFKSNSAASRLRLFVADVISKEDLDDKRREKVRLCPEYSLRAEAAFIRLSLRRD